MNPTNRPVDFLLNMESPSLNLARGRNMAPSNTQGAEPDALNRKENSFADVYRQQRREDSEPRQPVQQKRSAEQSVRGEQRSAGAQQVAQEKQVKADKADAEHGKTLPQGETQQQGKNVSAVAKNLDEQKVEGEQQATTEALSEDGEVAVNVDSVALVDSEAEAAVGVVQTSDKLTDADKQQPAQSDDADLNVELETGSVDKISLNQQQQGENGELEVPLAVHAGSAHAADELAADETKTAQEQAQVDQETLIMQARQTEAGQQQAATKTAEPDAAARAAQVTAASADATRELKQNRLAEVGDNTGKTDINTATAKAAASGGESLGQQSQDRLAQLTSAMDFKVLREQLAAGKVKVEGAVAGSGAAKGLSLEAPGANDAAADRQPRLNSLTQASQALSQARPGIVSAGVQPSVGSPEWSQAMSQRIMWLANRGISAAELQLNPRDLGPVDVRINVNGDQATVQFSSQHAAVREALESSVVRLREMMESSGLNLADVDVSDQSQSEQAQAEAGDGSRGGGVGETDDGEGSTESVVSQRVETEGLVDFYA